MKYIILFLLIFVTPLMGGHEDGKKEKISSAKKVNHHFLKDRFLELETVIEQITGHSNFQTLLQNFEQEKTEANYELLSTFLEEQFLIYKKQIKNLVIVATDDENFPLWNSSDKNSFKKYMDGSVVYSDVLQVRDSQ